MAITENKYAEFLSARNQIQWIERYLYELNALLPQELPEHANSLGQPAMAVAPHFFMMLADLLLDQAALGVARLLDAPEQGSKKNPKVNLSMETVINACGWLDAKKKETHIQKLKEIKNTPEAKAVSQVRNTPLAHGDYDTVIDYKGWAQRHREKLAESDKTWPEVVGAVALKLVDLLDECRPCGEPVLVHPRYDKNWKGVAVVLEHLVVGEDGGRL
jgi:hypothetical protein